MVLLRFVEGSHWNLSRANYRLDRERTACSLTEFGSVCVVKKALCRKHSNFMYNLDSQCKKYHLRHSHKFYSSIPSTSL